MLPGSEQLVPVFFGLLALLAFVVLAIALVVRTVRRRRRPEGQPAKRPIVVGGAAVAVVVLVALTVVNLPPRFTSPEFPPIGRLFPDEAFFYRPVGDLPVAEDSARTIAAMGPAEIVAGFGGQPHDGVVWGIPFNLADDRTPREPVDIRTYPDTSFIGEYPVTDPAYIESMPSYGVDNHYVALDRGSGQMWELFATTVWFGRWGASSGARWDLDELTFPKWSTIAAQLPLLPGVLSYDEIERGRVDHVVHATTTNISSTGVVWPARATDGRNDDPAAVPMGAWLRLREDVDLDALDLGRRRGSSPRGCASTAWCCPTAVRTSRCVVPRTRAGTARTSTPCARSAPRTSRSWTPVGRRQPGLHGGAAAGVSPRRSRRPSFRARTTEMAR